MKPIIGGIPVVVFVSVNIMEYSGETSFYIYINIHIPQKWN